jgi:glucose/mannose-6-phosphate isomerase
MKQFVDAFDEQLLDAVDRIKNLKKVKVSEPINHIVICGLGGSGIGGSLVKDFFTHNKVKMPVTVCKDYAMPVWVNKNTLVIACSYSGNTEETLESVAIAQKQGAQMVCITSGGKLTTWAKAKKHQIVELPTGFPPRASYAYGCSALLAVCHAYGFINKNFITEIYKAASLVVEQQKNIDKWANAVAKKIHGKIPFIYAASDNEAVAVRLRQQLNENGKVLCSHNVIPEMNHNELVGWASKEPTVAVLILRMPSDHKRTQARMQLNSVVMKKYCSNIIEMQSMGDTFLERALYLVHLGDKLSVALAAVRNVDATEVKVIDKLKADLSKI